MTRSGRLRLCVELKAPGKGADPANFTGSHDRAQWSRYRNLPNLVYTDGSRWSLWHDGKRSSHCIKVCEDILDTSAAVAPDAQAAEAMFAEAAVLGTARR